MLKKSFESVEPKFDASCFIADNATLIGAVDIGENSSIWYNCVARADVNKIVIGKNTNIQDFTMIHCDYDFPTYIGDNVTVGHRAIIHGCKIGNNCLIGMGAIVMDGAEIGDECIIGAGSVVSPGKKIPARSVVMGIPGKIVKELEQAQIAGIQKSAETYVKLSQQHIKERVL